MTSDGCEEMRLLVQADVDGELQPAEAARVAVHLDQCEACTQLQAQLLALSARVRREAPRYPAPEAVRARIAPVRRPARRALVPGLSFGAGFAMAACLALFLVMPRGGMLADEVVAAHIRALQPGHLVDVVSTDQHTVKPWFDGRLPFAPPVKDFAAQGFVLAGGRLDYLGGRTAAVMVYHAGQHLIDLFAWPGVGSGSRRPSSGTREGYSFQRWNQDGMTLWAVSDLNAEELAAFVRDWQKP
jgi:anti-sigma factor RsiW